MSVETGGAGAGLRPVTVWDRLSGQREEEAEGRLAHRRLQASFTMLPSI